MAPLEGQGLFIVEVLRSYSGTPQSVGHIGTSDKPVAETSTSQHSQQTNIHAPGGIQTRNPSKRAATEPSLRLRVNWDRLNLYIKER